MATVWQQDLLFPGHHEVAVLVCTVVARVTTPVERCGANAAISSIG